jgi:LPXTG-motif cell wall-anchored protein
MFQKIAPFVGIILIVIAAVLLIGDFSNANLVPVVLGLLGLFVIGVFFLSKKKKWLVSNK